MSASLEGVQFEELDSVPKTQNQNNQDLDFVEFDEDEKPNRIRSLLSAAPKGFLKEFRQELMKTPILGAGLKKLQKQTPDLIKSDDDISLILEKALPTQDKFAERALERGGKTGVYAALGGGGIASQAAQALKAATSGFVGEGAKKLGLPDWAQGLLEAASMGLPSLSKKIRPTSSQKELVEGARGLGLSDSEIAPLIQSELKQKWLTKVAPKRGRTQQALKKSKEAIGNVYDRLETSDVAKKVLSPDQSLEVMDSIDKVLEKLPSSLRNEIAEDFGDLLKSDMTGETLINFWKDINHYIGKGSSQLGVLKGPITDALEKVSPKLAQDFRMTNQLYSKFSTANKLLKPSLLGDLMTAGRAVRTALGIFTGNFPLMAESLGESALSILSREMLINPRFQNLSTKMVHALNQGKPAIANQILSSYIKEIEELDPQTADLLKDIDFKSLHLKQ